MSFIAGNIPGIERVANKKAAAFAAALILILAV
jgi:hypothetical protein